MFELSGVPPERRIAALLVNDAIPPERPKLAGVAIELRSLSMLSLPPQTVDVNIPRFNQALVAFLTGLAFILQLDWVIAAVAAVLIVSRLGGPRVAPFTQLYARVVRPRLHRNEALEVEAAAPPRFAQLLGAVFLSMSTVALLLGFPVVGWTLALIVTALAALAASARICVGCLIYERTFT